MEVHLHRKTQLEVVGKRGRERNTRIDEKWRQTYKNRWKVEANIQE
jgi:hypothetical protein